MARTKYRSRRTSIDGITFASKKEARRYVELKLLRRSGAISELELQPRYQFPIKYKSGRAVTYVADFRYLDNRTGERVVEDVKGIRTPVYKLKAALMQHFHGITILET